MLLALGVAADLAGDVLGLLRVAHHEGVDTDEAEAEGAGDHGAVVGGTQRALAYWSGCRGKERGDGVGGTYVGEPLALLVPIEWFSAGLVVDDGDGDDDDDDDDSHRRAMRAGVVRGAAARTTLVRRAAERESMVIVMAVLWFF